MKNDKVSIGRYIGTRISRNAPGSFSALISRVSVAGIAVGLAVIIVSLMIFRGFKDEIREKMFSFTGHISVTKLDMNESFEGLPLSLNRDLFTNPQIPEIERIYAYAAKPALLKTDEEVMGVLLKGVGKGFDGEKFSKNIEEGSFISYPDSSYSKEIVISRYIADKLQVGLGDKLLVYFMQDPPRVRKLEIKGIYRTGMEDFDHSIVIGDLGLIRRINNWPDTLAAGYEIVLKDFENLTPAYQQVYEKMDIDMQILAVSDRYAHFFDWFIMLRRNVTVFLGIILFVACFNTCSILLILIMERTKMIGTLKALGADNRKIKSIFFQTGLRMTLSGMFWGNAVGLGFGFLQDRFKIIPLNPEYYYMDAVPIFWDWQAVLGANLLLGIVITLSLFVPLLIISQISPVKAIRFD